MSMTATWALPDHSRTYPPARPPEPEDRLIERIYLLRCQLVHGAATFNSSLNRTAIQNCSEMLDHLLRAFLLVWIDHGAAEDWGTMCYPPMRSRIGTLRQS